jgi:hypothetical protein
MQDFVEAEAQDVIKNARKLGLREDFNTMITQIYCQAYGLYMFARSKTVPIAALSTPRVLESLYKLVNQLNDLFNMASHWRDLSAAASGDQSDNQKRRNRHESQHEELTEDGPANLESAAQRAPDAKLRGRTPSRP